MFIYLDANVVQYTAKYSDFIFQVCRRCPVKEPKLRREIMALRYLAELDQYGDWTYIAPRHLLDELKQGQPTPEQLETYKTLDEAWRDCYFPGDEPSETEICRINESLFELHLKDPADRRHLAEALSRHATWFLTNDGEVLRKTRGRINSMRITRPSECLEDISVGLFLR